MKLVINIDEEEYKAILDCAKNIPGHLNTCEMMIANGTPLPKGHGRLIDADNLPLNAIDDANYGSNYIRIAPTIIEADKGERSDKE